MVSAIHLAPTKAANNFDFAQTGEFLAGLKQINAFIGKNNSGKSRLVRFLFQHQESLKTTPFLLSEEQ